MMKTCALSLLTALTVGLGAGSAMADGLPDDVLRARILSGWDTADGTHIAGLELRLADGWKTYWRAPGDAGIPPQFDWSGSDNISGVRFYWPTPEVVFKNGMRSIVYQDIVVLPIEFFPADKGRPMEMQARVELGVCQDICMPISFDIHAMLDGGAQAGPIKKALSSQPLPAYKAGVGDVTCKVEPISDGLRVTARIDVPQYGLREVAVIEAGDPAIWVSEAEVTREGGTLVAVADLVPPSAAPFALDRSGMRFTLLSDSKAIDIMGCTAG